MFDVVLLKKGVEVPDGTCYLIAKGGVLLKKGNSVYDAIVPVNNIASLEQIEPSVSYKLPPIGKEVFYQIWYFFREVYKKYETEVNIFLYFNTETQQYHYVVPRQEVYSNKTKSLDTADRIMGSILVGTIHSHAHMSAFHSSIDDTDERFFDGLHITLGQMHHKDSFDVSVSMVVNSHRFIIDDPTTIIDGITQKCFSIFGTNDLDADATIDPISSDLSKSDLDDIPKDNSLEVEVKNESKDTEVKVEGLQQDKQKFIIVYSPHNRDHSLGYSLECAVSKDDLMLWNSLSFSEKSNYQWMYDISTNSAILKKLSSMERIRLSWYGELCRFNKEGYHLHFVEKVYSLAPKPVATSIAIPTIAKRTYNYSSYNRYWGSKLWTFIDKFSEGSTGQHLIDEDMQKLIYRDFVSSAYDYAKSKIFGVENAVPNEKVEEKLLNEKTKENEADEEKS